MTKKKVNCHYELLCLLNGKVKNAASYEYYTILGLKKENNPSSEEIEKVYQQIVLKWHPDKIQQRESREPTKEEKNKWHEIEIAYGVLSDPGKRQKYDLYDGKNKYEKMIIDIENMMEKENVKIEEKDWKPVRGEGNYVLFYFNSERKKVEQLQENILIPNKNLTNLIELYLLINLTDEKKNKIKLTTNKTDKLQPNKNAE